MRESGSDMEVFQNYETWLDTEMAMVDPDGENSDQIMKDFQSMKSELSKMTQAWVDRRDYILDHVFGERLQVADDQLPVLESLDCLEKLSGETRLTSPSGKVQLNHLQTRGKRVHWHVARDLGKTGYLLHADVGKKGMEKLETFFGNQNPPFAPEMRRDGNRLVLHIPQSQVQAFNHAMQEVNVIAHKGQTER